MLKGGWVPTLGYQAGDWANLELLVFGVYFKAVGWEHLHCGRTKRIRRRPQTWRWSGPSFMALGRRERATEWKQAAEQKGNCWCQKPKEEPFQRIPTEELTGPNAQVCSSWPQHPENRNETPFNHQLPLQFIKQGRISLPKNCLHFLWDQRVLPSPEALEGETRSVRRKLTTRDSDLIQRRPPYTSLTPPQDVASQVSPRRQMSLHLQFLSWSAPQSS